AHSHHGVNYGTNRVTARIGAFGQSTSPGASFGLDFVGWPLGVPGWLIANVNVPGPGFLCPPLLGVGTSFWVDPTLIIQPLGVLPFGNVCFQVAVPLGPGLPPGLEIFVQAIFLPTGSGI